MASEISSKIPSKISSKISSEMSSEMSSKIPSKISSMSSETSSKSSLICTCNWVCPIRGCKTLCQKTAKSINDGNNDLNIQLYKDMHDNIGNIFVAVHLWGFYVKPECCPYMDNKCYVLHIALHHNEHGCKLENSTGKTCLFRCQGCNKHITPTQSFKRHAENHSRTSSSSLQQEIERLRKRVEQLEAKN